MGKEDDEIFTRRRSLVDISEETEYVKEVKDILDELNSIKRIFEQQQQLITNSRESLGPKTFFLTEGIKPRLQRLEQLEHDAIRVYDAVSALSFSELVK